MSLSRSVALYNGTGVRVEGSGAELLLGQSVVTLNATGVSSTAGAVSRSYKTNQINANGVDGTPITGVDLQ
jgi:hypothetical protein